jgi:RNA polymerase sigma-70 factor (ECF subfamily)
VCRRIAGPTRDSDDACQEALIKIVRNLGTFDGRSAFGTWAYRIATNAALDELRKRRRRPLVAVDDDTSPEPVDTMAPSRFDQIGDRLAVDEALGSLPDEFRVAVTLRDLLDLDYAEIAELLEIPAGTVKSRIARGRSALAKILGDAVLHLPEPADGNHPDDSLRPIDPT